MALSNNNVATFLSLVGNKKLASVTHLTIKSRKKWFLDINWYLHSRKDSHEGVQNESPQNVPVWHVNYFEMKIIKTHKAQEEFFTSPLSASKNLDRGPGARESYHQK